MSNDKINDKATSDQARLGACSEILRAMENQDREVLNRQLRWYLKNLREKDK